MKTPSFKTTTEQELIEIRVEDHLIQKKIVYLDEFNEIASALNKKQKKKLLKKLLHKPYIKQKEDMFKYDESVQFDNVMEEEIFSSVVKPEYINTTEKEIEVGDNHFRGLYTKSFPPDTHINWLARLAGERGNVDFSIHIHPEEPSESLIFLQKQLDSINYDISVSPKERPDLEEKAAQLKQKITELTQAAYKRFKTSLFIATKGDTFEKADSLSKKMVAALNSVGIGFEYANKYQDKILKSLMPFGKNFLKSKRLTLPGDCLAEADPFSYSWLDIDEEDGIPVGWNENGLPIAQSLWRMPAYSGMFSGPTGSGKSYCVKAFIDFENVMHATRVIVIDPASTKAATPEYQRMCDKKDGNYVAFSTHSRNLPSILALYGDNFQDAILDVASLLSVLLGDKEKGTVTDAQKPLLEAALIKTYDMAGVTENKKTWKKIPQLDLLATALKRDSRDARSEDTKRSYEALTKRLSRFTGRGMYNFINTKESTLSIDNPFTVFVFKDTPDDIKPVLTGIVMNYIREKAMGNLDRTLIVLEEAHLWLNNPILSQFIARLVVTLRKSNTGILLIFQSISQIQNCKEGITVLGNLDFKYVMGCKKAEIDITAAKLDLNDVEQNYIVNSGIGEGILIWGNKHYRVNIQVDEETDSIITTRPEEVKKLEEEEKKHVVIDNEVMEHLKEDIGYRPESIEEGAEQLVAKISKGQIDINILKHYPRSYRSTVHDHLSNLKKGLVEEPTSHGEDIELESIAKDLMKKHTTKQLPKSKKRKTVKKKKCIKKRKRT